MNVRKLIEELGKVTIWIIVIYIFTFIDMMVGVGEYSFVIGVLCGVVGSAIQTVINTHLKY